ncbi:MAG: hypothetical protein QOG53_1301 [Frankiales bacterium]|jgi:hypothetical protein|nr:hypothetical protein [Frankiales bacterium]
MFEYHGARRIATDERIAHAGELLLKAGLSWPGPARIAALSQIDLDLLTPEQKLGVAEQWDECRHWLDAQQQTTLASLAATPRFGDDRWCAWEVGSALRIGDTAAHSRISAATDLSRRLHDTLDLLEDGRISYQQAFEIADGTWMLTDDNARTVEATVLRRAPEQTRAETRRAVEKAVLAVDPEAAEERRRQRRRERRVERPRPVGDGQSGMWVEGPTEAVVAVFLILTAWAKQMKRSGQVDTIGAGRFDALVGLVFAMAAGNLIAKAHIGETSLPPEVGPVPATVGLVVKASTAAGQDDDPADIPGYGPISASVARRVIAGQPDRDADDTVDDDPFRYHDPEDADGRWDSGLRPTERGSSEPQPGGASVVPGADLRFKLLPVDPATGWLTRPDDDRLDLHRDRRTASKRQRGYVVDRDRECFVPSCGRPAEDNDVDHRDGWTDGGKPTSTPWDPAAPTTTAPRRTMAGRRFPGLTAQQHSSTHSDVAIRSRRTGIGIRRPR